MLTPNNPVSIYLQCASFCFLCAGNFSDLLVVRCCLLSAYSCLAINALMGSPLWPALHKPGYISLDALFWCFCCLYTYACSIVRLLLDESHVRLTEDQEALWRMLYRLGGVSRKVFGYDITPCFTVQTFKDGQELNLESHFYIVYKGLVHIEIHEDGKMVSSANDGSGCLFDFKSLGLLHSHYHSKIKNHKLKVTCITNVTAFEFAKDTIRSLASKPNIRSVWQTVFIGTLTRIAVMRMPNATQMALHDEHYVDPLFTPLTKSELPPPYVAGSGHALENPFRHLIYYITTSFSPPWPFGGHFVGFRHRLPAPLSTEVSILEHEMFHDTVSDETDTEGTTTLLKANGSSYGSIL